MSAQVIDFSPAVLSASPEVDGREVEAAEDNHSIINKIHFETLYQVCFAPEPSAGEIAMAEFLLQCD